MKEGRKLHQITQNLHKNQVIRTKVEKMVTEKILDSKNHERGSVFMFFIT